MDLEAVIADLARAHGIRARATGAVPVGGGCINHVLHISTDERPLLLKMNAAETLPMFEAEAQGLEELRVAGGVRVPEVLGCGSTGAQAYLALEWLTLAGKPAAAERRLGAGLARQHRVVQDRFGWRRDNWIGTTPQPNPRATDWADFVREARIGFQLALAARNGLPARCGALGKRVLTRLERILAGHTPQPSLLHGDLWGGNWAATPDGVPCVYDPAVYYGDREADLAMTRLFGGFGHEFYEAYEKEWPLEPGWEERSALYDLYHLLNHFNLFGAGYLPQVERTLLRLARNA